MKPSRGNTGLLAERAASGASNFLSSKDFTKGVGRRIRPFKWIYNNQVVDMMSYLEGWVDVKGKEHGAPIRFELDDVIPENTKWKKSVPFGGSGNPVPQVPQAAIAFLCYDYKTQMVKCVTFTQKTIINIILSFLDEKVAGEDNELYVEDLSEIDIIITKGEKAYTVTTQSIKTKIDVDEVLNGLTFSWESFMGCGDCFGDSVETTYDDVKKLMNEGEEQEEQPKKKTIKKEVVSEVSDEDEDEDDKSKDENLDWENTLSPQGKKLGGFTDEKLVSLYEFLKEKKSDPKSLLFRSVIKGCLKRELIEIPF